MPGADMADTVRVVFLGASNLSLGWPYLMERVFFRHDGPLEILTAHGMGRSYVADSRFGWRVAPGILECGLWDAIRETGQPMPAAALITDLGNDLVYGRSAALLADAAAEAVDRLRGYNSECSIVVTRPPMESIASLSGIRFRFFRTVLFPGSRRSLAELVEATTELDDRIRRLDGVTVVPQPGSWFGFDPIHIRRRFRRIAFTNMLAAWPGRDRQEETQLPVIPLRRPVMASRRLLGRLRTAEQPSVTGGVSVSAW